MEKFIIESDAISEFKDDYRFLSNFHPVIVHYKGRFYPSVEHAYMSAKSNDVQWKRKCAYSGITAGKIKRLSRTIKLVDDWDDLRLEVMEDCLRYKFGNPLLASLLKSTRSRQLVEGNLWGDCFWGVDLLKKIGLNHLGRLLMLIREEL